MEDGWKKAKKIQINFTLKITWILGLEERKLENLEDTISNPTND